MTPTGIEPVLPPWKGDVLTAWPRSRSIIRINKNYDLPDKKTPRVGLEPTTARLTAACSTNWAIEEYEIYNKTTYLIRHLYHMHCMWIPSKLHTELRQPTVKLQSNFQCEHRSLFGQALDRLVTVSSTRYRASTSAYLPCTLQGILLTYVRDISSWGGLHA